jgi:hypothetical protein
MRKLVEAAIAPVALLTIIVIGNWVEDNVLPYIDRVLTDATNARTIDNEETAS